MPNIDCLGSCVVCRNGLHGWRVARALRSVKPYAILLAMACLVCCKPQEQRSAQVPAQSSTAEQPVRSLSPQVERELLALLRQEGDVETLKTRASELSPQALVQIAQWLFEARDSRAVDFLKLASSRDDAQAQWMLASCHLRGTGVPKDAAAAHRLFKLSADQGQLAAAYQVGRSYLLGRGVERDYDAALKYYRLAADGGIKEAFGDLGVMYAEGWGVTRNSSRAFEYYSRGAALGDPRSLTYLGNCYVLGHGTTVNKPLALKSFLAAADQGMPFAQCSAAMLLLIGDGVPQDEAQAVLLLRKAAVTDMAAQNALAYCLAHGRGTPRDETAACELWQRAAEGGHPEAMLKLGLCYDMAFGVEKNARLAKFWILKAAAAGNADAGKIAQQKYGDATRGRSTP
jgi:TPR repeat protein